MRKSTYNAYTSGIFDLAHAGHFDTINKILDIIPKNSILYIGVCTDEYCKSFKRTPIRSLSQRMTNLDLIYKWNSQVEIIIDPLDHYKSVYTEDFYNEYNIKCHYQGSDFDENSTIYEVMKNKDSMVFLGRSDKDSTTKIITDVLKSSCSNIGGTSNDNYYVTDSVVKVIKYGQKDNLLYIYPQLVNKKLFGVTHFTNLEDIIIYNYVPGEVRPLNLSNINSLIKEIQSSCIDTKLTLNDIFKSYKYNNEVVCDSVCHGDLVYTNVIVSKGVLVPIDFEYTCKGPNWWDIHCYALSVFLYYNELSDFTKFYLKNYSFLKLKYLKVVAEYWLHWALFTNQYYFNDKLKSIIELCG